MLVHAHRNPDHVAGHRSRPGYGAEHVARVRAFHRSLPAYRVTPLHDLQVMAAGLGLGKIWLKDESQRFGLESFKGLGASYALDRVTGSAGAGPLTFVTATDGNHGRAVAWAARAAGHDAVVFVPAGASAHRVDAIAAFGADVRRVSGSYDDACALAADAAERHGWVLLQDTARRGYEQIPRWIMQGYTTLVDETLEQLAGDRPTHVFLQCGVGSFAAAASAYFMTRGGSLPTIVLVEPARAACALAAFASRSDDPPALSGETHTFMACLSCGQLSTIAWSILRIDAAWLLTVEDDVARTGMRRLAAPTGADPAVISGESGAATTGALMHLCAEPDLDEARRAMGLGRDSRVLLVSTEGSTDPEIYRLTLKEP